MGGALYIRFIQKALNYATRKIRREFINMHLQDRLF